MAGNNTIQLSVVVNEDGTVKLQKTAAAAATAVESVGKSAKKASPDVYTLSEAAKAAQGMIAALTGAAIATGAGAIALATGAASAGDEIYNMAQRTGLAIGDVQELAYAFESSGSSASAMESGVRSLSLKISDAVAGNKDAIASFKAIGISVDDINPKTHTLTESFRLVVDQLTKYNDDANKTAIGNDLMGRSFAEMRPAIQGGTKDIDAAAEKGRSLGKIFSDEVVIAAHEVNDSFDDLKTAIKGVANAVGVEFFPLVKDIVERTTEWIGRNRELIATKVKEFIDAAVTAAKILGPIILKSAEAVLNLAKGLGQVNPELLKFAGGAAVVVGGAGAATGAFQSFAESGTKVVDTGLNIVANFKAIGVSAADLVAKVKALQVGFVGFRSELALFSSTGAAAFGIVAGAAALLIVKMRDLSRETDEALKQNNALIESLSRTPGAMRAGGLALDLAKQRAELTAINAQIASAEAQMASGSGGTGESIADLTSKAEALQAQIDQTEAALGKANKALVNTGTVATDTGSQFDAMVTTWESAGGALGGIVPPAKEAGDAVAKAADQLAQLRKSAADSAVALVAQVAAQGDAAATSEVYGKAIEAVVKSYNAQIAAIDASATDAKVKEEQKAAAASDAGTKIQQAAQGVVDAYKKQEQAIAQLDAAIAQSKLSLLDDDIRAITEDWNELSTTQRESELPEVLAAVDEKYRLLIESATDAAEAQKAQGVTAAEAERIDANLALTTEHLNNQLEDEKQAWEDAASGAKTYITFAKAVEEELDRLSGSLSSLAASLLTGQTGWDDAGKAVAGIFLRGFEDILASQLEPLINNVLGSALSIAAEIGGSILSSILPGVLNTSITGAATSGVATAGGIAAGGSLASAVGTGFSTIGSAGLTAVIGETGAAVIGAGLGAAAVGAAIVTGVAGIGLGIAAAFGAFDGPDMQKRISRHLAKMISNAFGDPSVQAAVDAALQELGFELTAGIQRTIEQTPISGAEVRAVWAEGGEAAGQSYTDGFYKFLASEGNGINNLASSDLVNLYFPGLDAAGEAAAVEAAKMAGAATASMQGLTGPDALVFTEQFAAGLVNVAHTLGLTEEEFLKFVNDVAGPGAAQFAAALDQLNGAAVASLGPAGFQGLLEDVSSHMERVFGVKNIDATNLLDVFIQSGASAEAFAAQLERLADSDPALRRLVDSMDPPLLDALHDAETATQDLARAFGTLSGASNASLADVVADFERFAGQIRDAEGELTTMGAVLVEQTRTAIGGMQSAILEDSQVTLDEAAKVFEQLALIPAEALSDPSVKAAYDEIIANLLAGTDSASVDQLQQKIAEQAVAQERTAAAAQDQANATAQAAASTDAAATSTEELNQALASGTDEFAALAEQAGMSSAQVQAALAPIIGTPDDGQSLSAMNDVIARAIPESLTATTDEVLGATGAWKESFDYSRGAVIMLHDELTGLAGNYDVTVTTTYVTVGEPPPTGTTPPPTGETPEGATGGWIPGPVGQPFPMVAHGGEFLIPAEIARRVVGGGSVSMPAPSASSGPSVDSVAAAVEARLTQGGRYHVLVVDNVDYEKLAHRVASGDAIPRAFANGTLAVQGTRVVRNPGAPQ